MYQKYIKRIFDFVLALFALIILSPLLLTLTVIGFAVMKQNPFFVQERLGKNEQVFRLIKFKTMVDKVDKNGVPLPDEVRLTPYGRFLRSTSCDELPSLINILLGSLSIVGPRPLLVKYLPYYTTEQRHRHDVQPGLTGYAQVNGRNSLSWDKKLELDLQYVENISFLGDVKIILDTLFVVVKRDGISQEGSATMEDFAEFTINKQRRKMEEKSI